MLLIFTLCSLAKALHCSKQAFHMWAPWHSSVQGWAAGLKVMQIIASYPWKHPWIYLDQDCDPTGLKCYKKLLNVLQFLCCIQLCNNFEMNTEK